MTLSTIKNCEDFKQQYIKYNFLWKQDLHQTLEVSGKTSVMRAGVLLLTAA